MAVSGSKAAVERDRGAGLALARAALALDNDGAAAGDDVARLSDMAACLRERLPEGAGPGDRLFALNTGLFHELAFVRLRDRYDPEGLLLHRVLERRAGHPVALALIYLVLGRMLGLELRGVALPGNLLVRAESPAGPTFIDPAAGGMTMGREDLELMLVHAYGFEKSSGRQLDQLSRGIDDRQVLVKLLSELKRAYVHREQPEKALWAADSILSLRPDSAAGHRERARLLERLDCPDAARADYRRYLELAPRAVDEKHILARIARLQDGSVILH